MVHIKKVEIFGFKSFGFRNTTVQFEPGLVSISGPNGSGKSNILDAIIFAMGENKPRIMRVDRLRSLIHDIDGNRHGPKMARSSVHFDNSDRKIPVDSDSVTITREMDVNGENTYYLNKKKTNRSHILDLLDMADAGLGQLNAIQQGTVTRISEFTSDEKRKAIEDLIGLSYFDEKKKEAVDQLDAADRRLQIALAQMDEVKKRIDELDEDRNQMMRHDMLEKEIARYGAVSAANRIRTISDQKSTKVKSLDEIKDNVLALHDARDRVHAEVRGLENQRADMMADADNYNTAKSSLDTKISAAQERYTTDSSTAKVSKRRIAQIDSRIPEVRAEVEGIGRAMADIDAQALQASKSIDEISARMGKTDDSLNGIDSQRSQILARQSDAVAKKSKTDEKIRGLAKQLNSEDLKLSKAEYENGESGSKIEANRAKLRSIGQGMSDLAANNTRLESLISAHEKTIRALESRTAQLRGKRSKTSRDMDELGIILEKSEKAAIQYESKIKMIRKLMHEDYTIAELKADASKLGIEGLVYEMITWDKTYERPVMAACSDWIKAVVVKDFATLLGIAAVAKSRRLPKLKIIPMDAIPPLDFDPPDRPGVRGVLADYVRCDRAHSALKTLLFGNIILTDSKESAYALSQEGYKAVTIEGEYFEAENGAVVIEINSKISKLTRMISMSSDIDGLRESIGLIKEYLDRKRRHVRDLDDSIQSSTDRLAASRTALATTRENHSNLESRMSSTIETRKRLEAQISAMQSGTAPAASDISACKSRIDSIRHDIALAEKEYAGGQESVIADKLSAINQKKIAAEELHTRISGQHREASTKMATLQVQASKEKSRRGVLESEEKSLESERRDLHEKVQRLEADMASENDVLVQLREQEQELIATSGSSIGHIKEYDEKIRTLSDRERKTSREIGTLERHSDALERDVQDLTAAEADLQRILDAFGLDRDVEVFDVVPVLDGLKAELASLVALNAKAPETYLTVTNGYRSMSARKNSLEEERNSIVAFIDNVEKDKRQTFLDAFDRVDREIRLIFNKMTGGNAWLELQNEDDIFNSGISYLIQFPDKPKRESTSISGGEKTLAAIVFVLALQRLKPSPFYLLDEVDAHLDAPNSERLAKILEERSQKSQFIMVSLKDSVVQKARLIYGVFPKNGVSHVVTYKDKRVPSVRA